ARRSFDNAALAEIGQLACAQAGEPCEHFVGVLAKTWRRGSVRKACAGDVKGTADQIDRLALRITHTDAQAARGRLGIVEELPVIPNRRVRHVDALERCVPLRAGPRA